MNSFKKKFLIQAITFLVIFLALTLLLLWMITLQWWMLFFATLFVGAIALTLTGCKISNLNKKDTFLTLSAVTLTYTLMGIVFFSDLPLNVKGHLIVVATLVGVLYIWVLTKLGVISRREWS